MLLALVCVPPPQVAEQALQEDHAVTTQSMAQGWVLQACVLVNTGHAAPPKAGKVVTIRFLDCVPPPHTAEQLLQLDQALTTQSIGQGWLLHDCVSVNTGQACPPLDAGVTTVRIRDCVPPPQTAEQVPQLDQAVTTQSTGPCAWAG